MPIMQNLFGLAQGLGGDAPVQSPAAPPAPVPETPLYSLDEFGGVSIPGAQGPMSVAPSALDPATLAAVMDRAASAQPVGAGTVLAPEYTPYSTVEGEAPEGFVPLGGDLGEFSGTDARLRAAMGGGKPDKKQQMGGPGFQSYDPMVRSIEGSQARIGEALEEQGIESREILAERNAEIQELSDDRALEAEQQKAAMATAAENYEKMKQDFANEKVDSKRFWNDLSTGKKIQASIALALGAMGQAFIGGQNAALGILQSSIDRDIEDQRTNLSKKQSELQEQRGLLADLERRYGNSEQAYIAARALAREKAADQIEEFGQITQSIQARENANIASQQLRFQAAQLKNDLAFKVYASQMKKNAALRDTLAKQNEEVDKLSTRFEKDAAVQKYEDTKVQYQALLSALESDDPAAQYAAIKQFEKLYDPGAIVRDSDQKNIMALGSLYNTLVAKIGKITEGQMLTDQVKQDIRNTAAGLMNVVHGNVLERAKAYTKEAEYRGIQPWRVLMGRSNIPGLVQSFTPAQGQNRGK